MLNRTLYFDRFNHGRGEDGRYRSPAFAVRREYLGL
jgi:hypothetical protein